MPSSFGHRRAARPLTRRAELLTLRSDRCTATNLAGTVWSRGRNTLELAEQVRFDGAAAEWFASAIPKCVNPCVPIATCWMATVLVSPLGTRHCANWSKCQGLDSLHVAQDTCANELDSRKIVGSVLVISRGDTPELLHSIEEALD